MPEHVRTLVVDDEEDMRLLVKTLIEIENRELVYVGEAASGHEAIDRANDLSPTAVVLDSRMPGMSGVETAAALLEAMPDLRIILYSAYIDDATVEAGRRVGIQDFVAKPDEAGLISALRQTD